MGRIPPEEMIPDQMATAQAHTTTIAVMAFGTRFSFQQIQILRQDVVV